MRLPFLALICLIALPGGIAGAADGTMSPAYPLVMQRFTDEDGLPLNSLTALLQARDGYLWAASVGGLARFDGMTFTRFPSLPHRPRIDGPTTEIGGLPSIRILDLVEDAQGRIWIATQDSGITLHDHGRLLQLDTCGGTCQINQLVAHDGGMYVATDMGLFRVDVQTLHSESLLDGEDADVGSLAFDRQGRIFALVNGAFATLEEREPWLHDMPEGVSMPNRLVADGPGIFMTAVSGLHHFDPATEAWTFHDLGPARHLYRAPDGALLVSTQGGRIHRQRADGDWEVLADVAPLLPDSMTQDTEGNLWIGTPGNGLLRLRQPWIGTLADPAFDMKHPGRSVSPDGEGGVWFVLACAHLRHWRADGRVERPAVSADAQTPCLETVHLGRDGTLWLGEAHGQLQRLRRGGEVEAVMQWRGYQPVRAIREQPDGTLLVAVRRSTLVVTFAPDGSLAEDPRPIQALEGLIVRQIVPSRRQGTWFIGEHGAVRLHGERIVERWGPEQGLSSGYARALHEEADGTLWIGTYGAGLNRIADGRITVYHQGNGLYDDTVSCILEDREGRLWMSGNRGITLVDPATATPTSIQSRGFAGNDGLTPAEANGGYQSSCSADEAGRFWFALVEGFAVLDPAHYQAPPTAAPPVRIERISVAGVARDAGHPLRLDARAQNIEIHYSAVALTTPKRLQFRFRLDGMDTDWNDAGATRHVVYPSLPWGDYAFQVQARIDGTPWPDTWAELPIQRPAPWYQRPWVWLACTLLALVLLLDATWQRSPVAQDENESD